MGRKLFTTALGAVGMAGAAARHVLWYVNYHMAGTTQATGPPSRGRRAGN